MKSKEIERKFIVTKFPILGGRLLKLKVYRGKCCEVLVSNPWREAIEEDDFLAPKEEKSCFQSLEGGY